MGKKTRFLALIMLIIFIWGYQSCDWFTPKTDTPPDTFPSWDTDGDNISNAVETNSANSYLGLDPNVSNANPSIAHGSPGDGWIEKALNLVNQGTGYYHYLGGDIIDTDDWSVLHLTNMVEGAGRDWYNSGYSPRIGVGDMSIGDAQAQAFGGPFPPHSWHQNGLDVDFRYVRNDGNEIGLNIASSDSIYYDVDATVALMNFLLDNANVTIIYVDTVHAGIVVSGPIRHLSGHQDHFHVQILDPDGTGN